MKARTPPFVLMLILSKGWPGLAIVSCSAADKQPQPGIVPRGDSNGVGDDSNSPDGSTGDSLQGDTHVVYCPPDGSATDEPICGTVLDEVELEWSDTLALCNPWTENASLDWETSHKVRVTIPAQTRTSLHRGAMEQWRIQGISIERGPLAAHQWRPSPTRATVVDYQLSSTEDYTQVHARLAYDLGEAGTLEEILTVYRRELSAPFVYSEDREIFWYQAVDWEAPLLVVTCEGQYAIDTDAVQVLVAERQGRRMSVARFGIAQDDGNSPFFIPEAAVVRFDDQPWMDFVARGTWAQVFSAMHHGVGEHDLIEFGRDPVTYFLLQNPEICWPATGPIPEQIQISDAGLEVTWIDKQGTTTEERWTLLPPANPEIGGSGIWSRVDDYWSVTSLASCDEPELWLLQEDSGPYLPLNPTFAFNALVCPQESVPGFALEALVVITFQPEFEKIGVVAAPDDIVPFNETGR
ncbi:hypothetical protein ACFL6C_14465, partial [Myxococcota bacterium]